MPDVTKPVQFNTPEADKVLAALQVFPPDNPWNEDIAKRPVHPGSAAIILEVRDSESGQVLGRALNQGIAGRNDEASPRSETGNRFDFSQLFDKWAEFSVSGLAALKAASPVDATGAPAKPAG